VVFVFLGFLWIIFMSKLLRHLQELPLTDWLVQKKPGQNERKESKDEDVLLENRVKLATSLEAL
jgi:hypothetical protein